MRLRDRAWGQICVDGELFAAARDHRQSLRGQLKAYNVATKV